MSAKRGWILERLAASPAQSMTVAELATGSPWAASKLYQAVYSLEGAGVVRCSKDRPMLVSLLRQRPSRAVVVGESFASDSRAVVDEGVYVGTIRSAYRGVDRSDSTFVRLDFIEGGQPVYVFADDAALDELEADLPAGSRVAFATIRSGRMREYVCATSVLERYAGADVR